MKKSDKERVVSELTTRLKNAETLIVTDYRGLTMTQIDDLRTALLQHGARFSVVKNTLMRRAADAAGAENLLALLEGPSAIAFLESGGDPVEVAKALSAAARTTRVLAIRGGVLQGQTIGAEDVENLAKVPPRETLHAQLVGALAAPMATVVGLFAAPMRDIVGVLQARIDQLEANGEAEPDPAAAQAAAGETPAPDEAAAAGDSAAVPAEEGASALAAEADVAPPDATGEPTDTQDAPATEGEEG